MPKRTRSLLFALALGLVVFAIGFSQVLARSTGLASVFVFLPMVENGGVTYSGYVGGPIPSSALAYQITPGLGAPVTQPGFVITANTGPTYRLVWTASGGPPTPNHFYGSIWTSGTFTLVKPGCIDGSCPLGAHGAISSPVSVSGGQRIDFDTHPGIDRIGLDFSLSADPAYFDLIVDGARNPMLVFFPAAALGGAISNVGTVPFQFTTH